MAAKKPGRGLSVVELRSYYSNFKMYTIITMLSQVLGAQWRGSLEKSPRHTIKTLPGIQPLHSSLHSHTLTLSLNSEGYLLHMLGLLNIKSCWWSHRAKWAMQFKFTILISKGPSTLPAGATVSHRSEELDPSLHRSPTSYIRSPTSTSNLPKSWVKK